MNYKFRHAICNEAYQGWDFADSCRSMKQIGYEGIEIAPFTLAEDPATVSPPARAEYARVIAGEGLTFVGLHWLMVAPKGLHVTTPDDTLRTRSWAHIRNLIDLCADLGPDGVMVFGSPTSGELPADRPAPKQPAGTSTAWLALRRMRRSGVSASWLRPCLPTRPMWLCRSMKRPRSSSEIGSPAVRTMFDSHNAVDETEPHDSLIARYFPLIEHVHVNETDGGHCGTGDYNFTPVLAALKRLNYKGWVSLEAFKFEPGAETIARESLNYLHSKIEKLN